MTVVEKTWDEVTDDDGALIPEEDLPPFVVDATTLHRWYLCAQVAERATGESIDTNEALAFAAAVFRSDIATDPEPTPLQEGHHLPGQSSFDPNQWRGRGGKWIKMPHPGPKPKPMKLRSPGTMPKPKITEAEIEKLGLNEWPKPGPKAREILGEGDEPSTFKIYGPEEPGDPKFPEYATDRAAKHKAMIAAWLDGKHPPEDGKPHALFMAGGTASGKSTLLRQNREALAPPKETTAHVDVDAIQEHMAEFGMPEYHEMREAGDHYAASGVHQEAGDIAVRMIAEALARGLNVIIDGTGNSEKHNFKNQLEEMATHGYTVDVLYVTRPTDESVAAAIVRAEDSGRFVPVPRIRQIHKAVSQNYRDEISKMKWLNSLSVYGPEGLLATMGDDGKMKTADDKGYAAFLAQADESIDKRVLKKLGDDPLASDPLTEAADDAKFPPETWSIEEPFDSADYLKRRGPWDSYRPMAETNDPGDVNK